MRVGSESQPSQGIPRCFSNERPPTTSLIISIDRPAPRKFKVVPAAASLFRILKMDTATNSDPLSSRSLKELIHKYILLLNLVFNTADLSFNQMQWGIS